MKNLICAFLISCSISFSQDFTKITEGDIVNDGGFSFGAAWGDLNGDGFVDLYVSNGGADGRDDQNFLYINNGDGTFTKITEGDITSLPSKSNGAALADYDNDGDLDVFVANRNGDDNLFFANEGDGTFFTASGINVVTQGGNTNGSSWTDYNLDGYQDLFAVNFFGESFLYTNNGDGTFSDFIGAHPATEINTSISSAWGDFDNDRDPDLFIPTAAGSGKENYLYINNGDSSFDLVSSGSIVTDNRASMGGTWGDFNNDGFLDLFVANQADFVNDLYINNGDGSFTALTVGKIVTENSFSISASFVDIDNDGDLDLYVTNWQGNQNFLYLNSGFPDYSFSKVSANTLIEDFESSMASAWADYDNDGDLDLFIVNRDDRNNQLFKNESQFGAWATFSLTGNTSGKSALHSKVRLLAEINGNSIWQMREITAGHSYNSQNDMRAHFGLGDASIIDSVIIEWRSGEVETFGRLQVNQFYTAVEGEGIPGLTSVDEEENLENKFTLFQNYPNPFNPTTTINYALPSPYQGEGPGVRSVKLAVFNALGEKVATLVNESKQPGNYSFTFNAADLPSGIYFYTLSAGGFTQTNKMMLIK